MYHPFSLIFPEFEELLAERDILVTYDFVRRWCQKFGLGHARKLKRPQGRLGYT